MNTDIKEILFQAGVIANSNAIEHRYKVKLDGYHSYFYMREGRMVEAQRQWAKLEPEDLPRAAVYDVVAFGARMYTADVVDFLIYQAALYALEAYTPSFERQQHVYSTHS